MGQTTLDEAAADREVAKGETAADGPPEAELPDVATDAQAPGESPDGGQSEVKIVEPAPEMAPAAPPTRKKPKRTRAHELAEEQRDIPISEFFEQNRHILGFDNPTHSLITAVKEAVDNALDACEQGGILPEVQVVLESLGKDELRIIVEDNGPGILEEQIPKVFGRLLYGSRFGSGKQSRGQQGIGISAAIMYGQLTTGRPAVITSRISPEHLAVKVTMKLDVRNNCGRIDRREELPWRLPEQEEDGLQPEKPHGTRVEFCLRGRYQAGRQSVREYLRATSIVNPHATISFSDPAGEVMRFDRAAEELPQLPKEGIQPHPHGVELGQLLRMAHHASQHQLGQFLQQEFSSMGKGTIQNVLARAALDPIVRPQDITRAEALALREAFQATSIRTPTSKVLVPIGPQLIKLGLKQVLEDLRPDYYTTPVSRAPAVFAGTPFLVEVGMVFGGNLPRDEPVQLLRFANRVPLLYQAGGCAITKAVQGINWRNYGLDQRGGKGMPNGPAIILVHVASTNIPFTSEAKEAVADIPEIGREIKLALRANAKTLARHLRKQKKRAKLGEKFELVQKVLPAMAERAAHVVGEPVPNLDKVVARIMDVVWIEEEIEFADGGIDIAVRVTNYRLRSASFKLRAEVPEHEIRDAEPRPGKREGQQVIWSVGLPTTESTTYRFRVPNGSRRSFEGIELWVEGIDSSHVIGAEPWTGVAAA